MNNLKKLELIMNIIFTHTLPKDQLGLFTEEDLARLIFDVLNN